MQKKENIDSNENSEFLWVELPATEKQNYVYFHQNAFEEDLAHAEKDILEFPRWTIISGYYCMHDLTKLFLAVTFNVKITSPEIHAKTVHALEHFVNDERLKEKLIELLKEAKNIYFAAERLKEKTLPVLLKRGKQERGKAQYYTEDCGAEIKVNSQKAAYFLDTIVRPYVMLVKELMK